MQVSCTRDFLPPCPVCSIAGGDRILLAEVDWWLCRRTSASSGIKTWSLSTVATCTHVPRTHVQDQDRPAQAEQWQTQALALLTETITARRMSPARAAAFARTLGFSVAGETDVAPAPVVPIPPLYGCPLCSANHLAARPAISQLADGRWQITAAPQCSHVRQPSPTADSPETLADTWNSWARRKLAERLDGASDEVRAAFEKLCAPPCN